MKLTNVLLVIVIITPISTISFPIVEGVDERTDNVKNGYGHPKEEILYTIVIYNDKEYIVDFSIEVRSFNWQTTILSEKFLRVMPNEEVVIKATVQIPSNPLYSESTSIIRIIENPHLIFENVIFKPLDNYYHISIITTLATESDTNNLINDISSSLLIYPFLLVLGFSSTYLWHGRKYFFFSTLYMNIPKEKIFDSQKREMISSYLNENNGSNLSQISNGTGIHLQTLRHHMKLFEQSEIVLRKDKKYFLKRPGSNVFDTEILSPVLQRLFEIIQDKNGITHSELIEVTNRSKPWIGNRIHELLQLDLIEIEERGRYKYIHPKGLPKKDIHVLSEETDTPINIHQNISNNT